MLNTTQIHGYVKCNNLLIYPKTVMKAYCSFIYRSNDSIDSTLSNKEHNS